MTWKKCEEPKGGRRLNTLVLALIGGGMMSAWAQESQGSAEVEEASSQPAVPGVGAEEQKITPLARGRALAKEGKLREALPVLREAIDGGSLDAEELYALILVRLDDPALYSEARTRLESAAKKGSLAALEEQGRLALEGGLGAEPDYTRARELLETAIKLPEASESFFLLGKMAAEGLGRGRDAALAVSLMRRGEQAGSASAMLALGQLFLGEGGLVEQDLPQAEELFRKAYERKKKEAAFYLGMIEERLRGEEPAWDKAYQWFKKAAELGSAQALKKMGDYTLAGRGGEEEEAFGFYQTAASLKDAPSAYTLGLLYEQGRTVPKDQVAAAAWMRIAADRGHALAQNQLGLWLLKGLGVAPDFDEALLCFEKSAEQGFPTARFNLAVLLLNGEKEEKEVERALSLLKSAAQGDHPEAAAELSKLHQAGKWLDQDPLEAAYWAARAARDQRFQRLAEEAREVLDASQQQELAERLKAD